MAKINAEINELLLRQAIEFFALSRSDAFVAEKIWDKEDSFTPKVWENKFQQKGLVINKNK